MSDTITYLDSASISKLLPTLDEQLDLIEQTYVAMARGRVELPPKPGIHPRPDAFVNAMPAYLADQDVAAMKWVSAYPGNPREGLPSISGLIILNDPETGMPDVIMDAAEITAIRTAVASGVSIRHLAHDGWSRVAILGYGEQGRQHARVVKALNPSAEITVYGGPRLRQQQDGVGVVNDARTAVDGADLVITAGPMSQDPAPVLVRQWLSIRCLVVPVDFDAYVTPQLVDEADLFVVDDVAQYDQYQSRGQFRGWPKAHASVGDALQSPAAGDLRVVCSLGVGAIDAAYAGAIHRRARAAGLGVT
ncbi:MAG: ornithine cyclodeaminase family protein, partial [Actinomycetes bacterium]